MLKGSCLCGSVTFRVTGDLPPPHACHCTKCRKFTGNFEAGTDIPRERVTIAGERHVNWFQSSDHARRGFCSVCGSSLFFDVPDSDWIGISMGAFDGPTNTTLSSHIFVADKGDYYQIADGLPQHQQAPKTP